MSAELHVVADGVWTIHHRDFSMGGMRLGTRSNLFRLADGTLAAGWRCTRSWASGRPARSPVWPR